MSGLGKNNASGADRAGSVWIVGHSDKVHFDETPTLQVRWPPVLSVQIDHVENTSNRDNCHYRYLFRPFS
jgi:hypothetical protein